MASITQASSEDSTARNSFSKSGYEQYDVDNSIVHKQVWLVSRLAAPHRLLKLTLIDFSINMELPVTNRRKRHISELFMFPISCLRKPNTLDFAEFVYSGSSILI